MKKFWLLHWLWPAEEGDVDPPAEDPDNTDDDAPPAEDPSPDPAPDPQPDLAATQRERDEARTRAERAERELDNYRKGYQPATPDPDKELWDAEEKILADPNCQPWQRYAVTANRSARAAQKEAQDAKQSAWDMADKAEFARAVDPKVHKQYAERVEKMYQEGRRGGSNLSRGVYLRLLIGDDALKGGKTAASPRPAVDRGKPATPRSDVAGRERLTAIQAAEKRVEQYEQARYGKRGTA